MKKLNLLLLAACAALTAAAYEAESLAVPRGKIVETTSGLDRFGVAELFPSIPGGRVWVSKWDDNHARELSSGARDPFDDEVISRGNGTSAIDGKGVLTMAGSAPRVYIYDEARQKKWQNIEVTAYVMRVADTADKLTYRGFGIGARSNHQDAADKISADGIKGPHNGLGYYGKVIYDGRIVFQKEIIHHSAAGYSVNVPSDNDRNFWKTEKGALPANVWIGVKLVVRNLNQEGAVKLELYRDLTDGKDGGRWEKVIEYVDRGGWTNPKLTPEIIRASLPPGVREFKTDEILLDGGVSVFVRNDGIEDARMKKMSIREIAPIN